MKSIIKYLSVIAAAFLAVSSVHAATTPAPASVNSSASDALKTQADKVTQSEDNLATVKDNTLLSPEEKLQREIAARKDIISQALNLSLKEVENLQASLLKLPEFDAESRQAALEAQFGAELGVYHKYYSEKADNLAAATNLKLDDVKAMAKEIIDYRDTVYNPDVKKIVDFLLLYYTSDATATASTRLDKIISDIKKLEKLNLLKQDFFRANLDKAAGLIKESSDLRGKAEMLILALPSDDHTDTTSTSSPATSTDASAPAAKTPTANDLLTASLSDIKATYEVFLQISKDIKKAVGIK